MSFLAHLEWRHATKAFDAKKSVSPADLDKIMHAIRMAPTSFGLQPFEVIVVEDRALLTELEPASFHQKQITTGTALFVFVARTDVAARIDQYMDALANGNADARAGLKGFEGVLRGSKGNLTAADAKAWTTHQAYIALGFGLAACAELQIDSCPMEGFDSAAYAKILRLGADEVPVVIMPVGYRDPAVPPRDKFRFPVADLFKRRK